MNSPFIVSPFEIKQVNEDEDNYIVEGMASVYGNIDLGDDIVESGAFAEDLMKRGNERPILWQHDSRQPIGVGEFKETSNGLYVKICMPKSDQFVRERVMPQISIGSVKGLSIGYSTEDFEYISMNDRRIRKLKRCGLRETSAVTFPMNEEAQIMAAKQYLLEHNIVSLEEDSKTVPPYKNYSMTDTSKSWDNNKAIRQIREKTGSAESPSESYKDGFLFYDPEKADSFGGYKLPYVYVEDGSFKAVPRALSAIVGVLGGARGGVDIPNADKEKIKAQLNKYYKKMGREEPFKSENIFIDTHTLKNMDVKDMHIIFEKDVILSSKAQEMVIKSLTYDEDHGEVAEEENNNIGELLKEYNKELDKTLKGAKNV